MSQPDILTFRPAHRCEARVLAELSRDLIEHGLGWRYTPARVATLISDPDHVALVACGPDDQGVLGFALMQFGDEHAHLSLLCVTPTQQRRGIGRRLIDWLIESANVAGIASIGLELRADNHGALAFYRRLGFVETQRVDGYYDAATAARRMTRSLRQRR